MAGPSLKELLDGSLPENTEQEIAETALSVDGVKNLHELKTRRSGISIMIEAHMVVDPHITVEQAHEIATSVESRLKDRFGKETQISIHIEPSETAE